MEYNPADDPLFQYAPTNFSFKRVTFPKGSSKQMIEELRKYLTTAGWGDSFLNYRLVEAVPGLVRIHEIVPQSSFIKTTRYILSNNTVPGEFKGFAVIFQESDTSLLVGLISSQPENRDEFSFKLNMIFGWVAQTPGVQVSTWQDSETHLPEGHVLTGTGFLEAIGEKDWTITNPYKRVPKWTVVTGLIVFPLVLVGFAVTTIVS